MASPPSNTVEKKSNGFMDKRIQPPPALQITLQVGDKESSKTVKKTCVTTTTLKQLQEFSSPSVSQVSLTMTYPKPQHGIIVLCHAYEVKA